MPYSTETWLSAECGTNWSRNGTALKLVSSDHKTWFKSEYIMENMSIFTYFISLKNKTKKTKENATLKYDYSDYK